MVFSSCNVIVLKRNLKTQYPFIVGYILIDKIDDVPVVVGYQNRPVYVVYNSMKRW